MILETKLTLPQPKAGALLRTGLIDRIKNNLDKKLILITAGAGYGKTTLLGQLINQAQLPAVFYSLDKGDSDLMIFYSYLIAGLEKLAPGLAARSSGLLKQGSQISGNYELLMGTLINELVEKRREEIFFVLDDYQNLVGDSSIHQALDFFIDHLPDIVHVIIAARGAVDFPSLSKWIAKQDAFTLDRERLAFMSDETKALLVKNYEVVTEEDIRQILGHTEGWITGIQLIMRQTGSGGRKLSINEILSGYRQTKPAAAAGEELFRYFVKEIFARETQPVRDFLANTSILETASPEICDALLEIGHSMKLLDDLEKRNVFISKIGPNEYKYHRLFKDFLHSQIGIEQRRALHKKAAEHYQKQKLVEQAIEHHLDARANAKAAGLIVRIASEMMMKAKTTQLGGWLEKLPEESYHKEPNLYIVRGRLLQEQGKLDEAIQQFSSAEKVYYGKKDNFRKESLAEVYEAQARILWQKGLLPMAKTVLLKSYKLCPGGFSEQKMNILNLLGLVCQNEGKYQQAKRYYNNALRNGSEKYREFYQSVQSNIALLLYQLGEARQALEIYKPIIADCNNVYSLGIGACYHNAANAAMTTGDFTWAGNCLRQGFARCTKYNDSLSAAQIRAGLGALHLCRQEWDRALAELADARDEFARRQVPRVEAAILQGMAHANRGKGNLIAARACIDAAWQLPLDTESLTGIMVQNEMSLLAAAGGRYKTAQAMNGKSLRLALQRGYLITAVRVRLSGAAIALQYGETKAAALLLGKALRISRLKGYDGLVISALRADPGLAVLAGDNRAERKYIDSLMPRIRLCNTGDTATSGLLVRLFGDLTLAMPAAAGGKDIPLKWKTRKEQSLFAYLLLHRERNCSIEELVDAFWPREQLPQAKQDIYMLVCRINKNLSSFLKRPGCRAKGQPKPVIHAERAYRLNPSFEFTTDVDEFYRRWKQANDDSSNQAFSEVQIHYRRCIELYRDGFLNGLSERWVEDRRNEYEKIYLLAVRRMAAYSLEKGDYQEAVTYLSMYLGKDPYDEDMHMQLWTALKALGLVAGIHKEFKALKKTLRRNLGEEPRADTIAKYNELTAG